MNTEFTVGKLMSLVINSGDKSSDLIIFQRWLIFFELQLSCPYCLFDWNVNSQVVRSWSSPFSHILQETVCCCQFGFGLFNKYLMPFIHPFILSTKINLASTVFSRNHFIWETRYTEFFWSLYYRINILKKRKRTRQRL